MEKFRINNIAAVGIIYNEDDPRQVFLEFKDDGYPITVFRNHLCVIGGNWIGKQAELDRCPRDTFCRELGEELSFEKRIASTIELVELGQEDRPSSYQLKESEITPGPEDTTLLSHLKGVMVERARHFRDYTQYVPKKAFRDPRRDDHRGLCSYFEVPLSGHDWSYLTNLQRRFGNLSNESVSLITSLDEIMEIGARGSWGHDQALRAFFKSKGCRFNPDRYPIFPDVYTGQVSPFPDYEKYLENYDVARRPGM